MKYIPSIRAAVIGLALCNSRALAQFPTVSFNETAAEFAGRADLDGNGLTDVIIVDKVSGAVRISYQTAAGVFSWDEPKASGIGAVTGVTAGRLLSSTKDALAVTAPTANRINLLTLALGAAVVPQSVFINPVGPKSLIAANLVGTISADDLWIGSALNSSPLTGSFDQFVNNPVGTIGLNANRQTSPGAFDRANAVVVKTGLAGTFAYLEHLAVGDTLRVISPGEAGAPVRISLAALPAESSYLIAPFAGATLANILTWKPGDAIFSSRRVSEPVLGTFSLAAKVNFPLPFSLGQLLLVPTSATASKLLAISSEGLTAAYFDFDGTTLSNPIEVLTAPAGEQFTGGVALPGFSGFHLLRGAAGDGRTTTSRYLKWSATQGKFTDVGGASFDVIGKRSGSGNVMLFAGEPFVSPTAKLVARLNARDWSSGNPPPGALNLTGEIYNSGSAGLHSPLAVALGAPPAGATDVLLNQFRPYLSYFSLSRAEGVSIGEPAIMPDGGLYSRTVQISFSVPPGMTVKFRDSQGSWTTYSSPGPQPATSPGDPAYESWWSNFRPLLFFKDTTIQYYGQVGTKRSAIQSVTYQFTTTPGTLSTLNDGVPDYVKIGLHYNPFLPPPNPGVDEQGSFLNHLLGGPGKVTDLRKFTSTALDFYVRPMSLNGYSNTTVPSLLANTPLPDGTKAAGNRVSAFDGGGVFLAGSDETSPAPLPAEAPGLRIWNPPFAEPSAKLSGLSGEGNGGYSILATVANFAIGGPFPAVNYPAPVGREMVALFPLPAPKPNFYQRSYTGGNDAAEAAAWTTGAINFYNSTNVPSQTRTLDSLDTMGVLLFERWLLLTCLQRNFLPPNYAPPIPDAITPPAPNPNFLSLTAFRGGEAVHAIGTTLGGAVFPTSEQLREIQISPPPADAYRLTDVIATIQNALRNSADPDIANLRNVVSDVYRISSRFGNESPGAFELPLDALRRFLATGAVSPGYGNKILTPNPPALALPSSPYSSLTNAQYASAIVGMGKVIQQIQARPIDDFNLTVRADSVMPGYTLLDQTYGGNPVNLVNSDGTQFQFPYAFSLTPGTHVRVTAYTDLPLGPGGTQIEVVDLAGTVGAEVTSIPTTTPLAGDNLLPDDWELFFFGKTGLDPFASPPGSGLSYLQIYLEGKDPLNPASYAGLQVILTSLPQLKIDPMPGGVGSKLSFKIPIQFADKFTFQLQSSSGLGNFSNTADVVVQTQPGVFEITPTPTNATRQFWRMGFSLK